jgi:hypothetical protein
MAESNDKIKRRPINVPASRPSPPPPTPGPGQVAESIQQEAFDRADAAARGVRGNATTKDGAATKCIYFRSGADVNQVERLVEGIPTASVSSIMSQLLSAFIQQGTAQAQAGQRKIVLERVEVVL